MSDTFFTCTLTKTFEPSDKYVIYVFAPKTSSGSAPSLSRETRSSDGRISSEFRNIF